MSPKSRGRPKGRGRPNRPQRPATGLRLADRILLDARRVAGADDVLLVELWASGWLGEVWAAAPPGESEPERLICTEVAGRATAKPTALGLAAVAALGRVAPPGPREMLAEAGAILAIDQPAASWYGLPEWTRAAAWRAVDVWESERVLFVEYGEPRPHTLMAVVLENGGRTVGRLGVLEPGAAERWGELREEDEVPMPITAVAPDAALADLAAAMRETDALWPRRTQGEYPALRALAWTRCRPHLPAWTDWEPTPSEEREELIASFARYAAGRGLPDDEVTRSLAGLFLDYGDGAITPHPLAWSPGRVALFLADHLPRKVALDPARRERLPAALRAWVRFALERRGVEPRWIDPVEEAVSAYLPALEDAEGDSR
ncbi:hypothetical protein HNP84_001640 [Thermocatellispora tengchongensis]|uniref:Uncharacterized protein n=1 Tax=Thermocatellispora tengchongensis TaxID=1073253 RepID=A0A840P3W0_9ACTN|nr:hypothetical protein [Thermocatellispora tengchongensis]MBB5131927.1 hypothetical protein [Thermocatellispora tengchongensis]